MNKLLPYIQKFKYTFLFHFIQNWKSKFNFELVFWSAALLYLGFSNFGNEIHFSFCPLHNLGISFCPGCGIGRAISFTLHGEFIRAFHAHWFGPVATVIIIFRILELIKYTYFRTGIVPLIFRRNNG